jgi:hypothetical protein
MDPDLPKTSAASRFQRPKFRSLFPNYMGSVPLLVNLGVFGLFAWFAFGRNMNALFYDFDGTSTLVELRNQLMIGSPVFAFTNDYLQSIGNIQLLQNAELLFFFWPIAWFADLQLGKLVVYLIIATIVFLSAYGLARLFHQSQQVALTAGWLLGVLAAPFVPFPFFYPILLVAPILVLMIASPVVIVALLHAVGRTSAVVDVLACLGLFGLGAYLLSANPSIVAILGPGAVPYVVLALILSRRRSEFLRKCAVLATVLIAAVCLRWPWFILGLFSDTAPYVFPGDFTAVYTDPIYISILFHGWIFGWAGPALVVAACAGALLTLRHGARELRVGAWTVLAIISTLVGLRLLFELLPRWIIPPPLYFEMAAWPLYALFAAVALQRFIGLILRVAGRLTHVDTHVGWSVPWALPVLSMAITASLIAMKSPTEAGYPFPPRLTPIVDELRAKIALGPNSSFNGRAATVLAVKQDDQDPWLQQFVAARMHARTVGNEAMSVGLWYYRIPTLFEYNAFISPAFHALVKRALQRPPVPHQRNITVLTYADARILKLLGVRYLIMKENGQPVGEQRAVEGEAGQRWSLSELSAPNLATYSPTSLEVRPDLASTLDFVLDERSDLGRSAVLRREVPGPLATLQSSSLTMVGSDLHLKARSDGRSLVIVPLEFSHCIELRDARSGSSPSNADLLRVDGLLAGVLFEHDLDAVLAFRTGPLRNPTCRWKDYTELKEMLR